MQPTDRIEQLRQLLRDRTGGYLRNVERTVGVTCTICATPIAAGARCSRCHHDQTRFGSALADLVVPVAYGGHNDQSKRLLFGYKEPAAGQPGDERRALVRLMFALAAGTHRPCLERMVGRPVDVVVTVPSTSQRHGHPLTELTSATLAALPHVDAVATATQPAVARSVVADRFAVASPEAVAGRHALVLDDTWTTGARAQSMALTLRGAGASRVSVMVLARWLAPGWDTTDAYLKTHPHRDFDPAVCPVADHTCLGWTPPIR